MQGLEPFLQELRLRKVIKHIPQGKTLVDLGCDYELTLVKRLAPTLKKAIGVDIVSQPQKFDNIELVQADLTKKLPFKDQMADAVTMLAVLEHLKNPERVVKEAYRILKPGGVFLVTVPAPPAEWLLEKVLAPMGLVRQEMIDQHENYFTHQHLKTIAGQAGFKKVTVQSWEFGFNTFMKAVK